MNSATGVQPAAAVCRTQPSSVAVLQTVAHELRQPLSAIESIAYYLNLVLPNDDGTGRAHAARLQELVEQSNWIITCALQLADPAPFAAELLDVDELITQTITARAEVDHSQDGRAGAPGVEVKLAGGLPRVRLDPARVRNLLENLLMLFQQVSGEQYPVTLTTSAEEKGVCLEIVTASPGYRSEAYLGPGSELSLESARRVVEAHGGSFSIEVDAAAGVRATVVLP